MTTFWKRLFGTSNTDPSISLDKPFTLTLANGDRVPSVYVDQANDPANVIPYLKLGALPRPAIFITGGAGKMSDEDKLMTRRMFEEGIAPFAQEHQVVVIDGGTQSGVIEMMATARAKGNFTFPLIGIAPQVKVGYKEKVGEPQGDALCPGHSQFVLVTGEEYGAESEMIIYMAHVLAGGHRDRAGRAASAVGIVINGGQITRQEVYLATTKHLSMPLVVLEGSGRFADELATAARTGETSQALLKSIISRGDIQLVSTTSGPRAMLEKLKLAFEHQP